jgi:tetratricopeptide (TPR) repeat protein
MLCFSAGCSDVLTYARDSREKGMTYYKQADYQNAAGAFRNAIRQDPADYYSHFYLGVCLAQSKADHQAIQQFKTTLDIMDHSLGGKEDVAFRQEVLDSLSESIARSEDRVIETTSLTTGPRRAEDLFVLAKVNRLTGDADNALENYDQASLLEPKNFYIAKEYGIYLEQLGQTSKAGKELRVAYALKDNDPQVIDSLRRCGVVPGPGLKDEKDLAKPIIPEGPIPTVRFPGTKDNGSEQGDTSARTDSPRD